MPQQKPFFIRLGNRLLTRQTIIQGGEHLPSVGPYIVAGNHQGFLDAPSVASIVANRTGQTPKFPTTPWIWRALCRLLGRKRTLALGVLPIDATRPGSVLAAAEQHLKQGGIIGIFPEGRRNKTSTLLPGKTGTVRLALAAHAPIVPVGVDAGQGGWFDLLFGVLIRRPIHISIGPPLRFTQPESTPLTKPQLDQLTDEVMQAISKLSGKQFRPR